MRPLPFLLALAFLGACTSEPAEPEPTEPPPSSSPSADLVVEVESAEDLVDKLIEEENTLTVVNFWATWCLPCRSEFPTFMAYDAAAEEGIEVRFVSVDEPDMRDAVYRFLDEHEVTEMSYFAPGLSTLPAQFIPMAGYGLPTTIVFDANGIAQSIKTGELDAAGLAEMVDAVRSES